MGSLSMAASLDPSQHTSKGQMWKNQSYSISLWREWKEISTSSPQVLKEARELGPPLAEEMAVKTGK